MYAASKEPKPSNTSSSQTCVNVRTLPCGAQNQWLLYCDGEEIQPNPWSLEGAQRILWAIVIAMYPCALAFGNNLPASPERSKLFNDNVSDLR